MNRTFTIPKTPIANAVDETAPQAPAVPRLMPLSELLSEPDPGIRSNLLFSFEGSLNMTMIALARNIITKRHERSEDDDTLSVDERAEADDAEGQNSSCYDAGDIETVSAEYAGNRKPMPPQEVLKRLGAIRRFVHLKQEEAHSSTIVPFVARQVSETVDFLINGTLAPVNAASPKIAAAAKVVGVDPKILADLQNAQSHNDRERLVLLRDDIIQLIEASSSGTAPDEQLVEEMFDSLPAHVAYNTYAAALNGISNAFLGALRRVLQGRGVAAITALGSIPIIRDLHARGMHTLKHFSMRHADELAEFELRGGTLREVRALPASA